MKSRKNKTTPKPQSLSECFLERAVRETMQAKNEARECNYGAAATLIIRRDVWLMASLIAIERKL